MAVATMLKTFVQLKKFDEAIDFIQKNVPESNRTGAVQMILGVAYAGKKQAAEAVDQYLLAYRAPDTNAETLFQYASELAEALTPDVMLDVLNKPANARHRSPATRDSPPSLPFRRRSHRHQEYASALSD
jgi:hypothetical protein